KIVKVCGIRTLEAAKRALDAGADMLGMIMVPGRARTVSKEIAKQISDMVHEYDAESFNIQRKLCPTPTSTYFDNTTASLLSGRRLLVGVFRNQPLDEILYLQKSLNLDIVQLHGSEPIEWCSLIPVPVIKRFTPGTSQFVESLKPGHHVISLLDGEIGGEGKLVDWDVITEAAKKGGRFMLAGGLNPENVAKAIGINGVIGVDVSGGVETNGEKDFEKIDSFVKNAKS
ncbi:phosphoribosylanthranilate isomerase, partial [Nadsonia fulvescens var. elongata DSM 6958]